tara:strand:+ start:346 stop:612 length:267 start_codon:yes stop_codon:yes gene_type:complete
MKIIVYTSPGCYWCKRLRKLLKLAELNYEERIIDTSLQWDTIELVQKYPEANSFPFVIIEGKGIGGLGLTARKLLSLGVISKETLTDV